MPSLLVQCERLAAPLRPSCDDLDRLEAKIERIERALPPRK